MRPAVEAAWNRLPKGVRDRVASGIDRTRGIRPPTPPAPDPSKPFRLLIGPVNYAGQGRRWGSALERTGQVSARNYVHEANDPYGYGADHVVSWRTAEYSRPWQQSMLETIRNDYTHVLIEACFPILGGMFDGDIRRQVRLLQDAGVTVAMVGHGNDVRLPSTHAASDRWSYFHDSESYVDLATFEPRVAANIDLVNDLAVPTFVSTAGLLADLPQAHFLGVVIEPERWANDSAPLRRDRPKVIHAPTHRHTKGTTLIEPTVRRLHDEGIIEYVEIAGVPNAQMPAVVADADVVLDQFRTGDYGVGACETMAAGRIPLTYVNPHVRAEVERHAGMKLPIPHVAIDTLEGVLRDIVAEPDSYRDRAATGPDFVRRLHSGTFSAEVLMRDLLAV